MTRVWSVEAGAGNCVWSHAVTGTTGSGGGQLTPGPETLGMDKKTLWIGSSIILTKTTMINYKQ